MYLGWVVKGTFGTAKSLALDEILGWQGMTGDKSAKSATFLTEFP